MSLRQSFAANLKRERIALGLSEKALATSLAFTAPLSARSSAAKATLQSITSKAGVGA